MFHIFKKSPRQYELVAPVSGQMVDLSQVPDTVFAEKMMGMVCRLPHRNKLRMRSM